MNHPILYKIGGRGQVLQWFIQVKKRGDAGVLVMEHGQKDGKLVIAKEVVEKGKHLGQSNETTPIQQAHLQAEARWKKQFDRYYRETIAEAETAAKSNSKPMLAHKYLEKKTKHLKKGEEIALQPKLDGMRCIASKEDGKVVLMSREGKVIESVPHIVSALEPILKEGVLFDGELYVHGMDFETIMSICGRKAKKLHEERETMEYHVYDIIDDQEFVTRVTKQFAKIERAKLTCVQVVDTHFDEYEKWCVYSIEQHLAIYEKQGYEGVMVRKLNMPYEHKRSVQLLKLKSFEDEEFRIVGSEDGKLGSSKADLLQTFVFTTHSNVNADDNPDFWEDTSPKERTRLEKEHQVFKASCLGKEPVLREMWGRRGEYVGEWATVCYQEKTKYDQPRFGKVKAIRGKEDLSS